MCVLKAGCESILGIAASMSESLASVKDFDVDHEYILSSLVRIQAIASTTYQKAQQVCEQNIASTTYQKAQQIREQNMEVQVSPSPSHVVLRSLHNRLDSMLCRALCHLV